MSKFLNVKHFNTIFYRNLTTLDLNRSTVSRNFDVVVVGGGIVGTSIAREIQQRSPQLSVALVEKENHLAKHQSSHNSGVIHTGIYYKPNSLKAKFCVEGLKLTYDYLDSKKIPYKRCGKLIIATNDSEVPQLDEIQIHALNNRVPGLQTLSEKEIREVEPHCFGIKALWSPNTGNVDFEVVTKHLAQDFTENGGNIFLGYEVHTIKESQDPNYPIIFNQLGHNFMQAKYAILCGGLHAEKFTNMLQPDSTHKTVSFMVDYKILSRDKEHLIKTNIYTVPNLPFLGVHCSPRLDGRVLLGPSAVPALSREGYCPTKIDFMYLKDVITYPGFPLMAIRNVAESFSQVAKTVLNNVTASELKKFVPLIGSGDVSCGPTAVQAQVIDQYGNFVKDYIIDVFKGNDINKRIINCRFIPSPGATSALSISKMIADKIPV